MQYTGPKVPMRQITKYDLKRTCESALAIQIATIGARVLQHLEHGANGCTRTRTRTRTHTRLSLHRKDCS